MRLLPVTYFGYTAMDRRFSSPMLPWIISEIRKRGAHEKLSLGIEDGHLTAYNHDFEVHFAHRLSEMTRFSQAADDSDTNTLFLYLLRDDGAQLLYCYLYQTDQPTLVSELYQQMKEHQMALARAQPKTVSEAALTSLCSDISPSCSNFVEVLYVGKIRVWHRRVPDTFIDDALVKFRAHDADKRRKKMARLRSELDLRRGSVDSGISLLAPSGPPGQRRLQRSHSLLTDLSLKASDVDRQLPARKLSTISDLEETEQQKVDSCAANSTTTSSSINEDEEHNRTMVLQVDRTHLRLISPDRKVLLLHKAHRDVATCVAGILNADHFGFIAREDDAAEEDPRKISTYVGYVFKCESAAVAGEAVAAITHAYLATSSVSTAASSKTTSSARPSIESCDRCPMVWFHRLCCDLEHLGERKQRAAIARHVTQLPADEQALIAAKYAGVEGAHGAHARRDQIDMLMMLLRAHAEMMQTRHSHEQPSDGATSSTIFTKAKRSLSISFEHLLKRRASRDDVMSIGGSSNSSSAKSREASPERKCEAKSPMMDIFMKVGNGSNCNGGHVATPSWRQAMFKRVRTQQAEQPRRTPLDGAALRQLWRTAIRQTLLLVRMERENARMRAEQEETAMRRIKLQYDELRIDGATGDADDGCCSNDVEQLVRAALEGGVARARRGEVWLRVSRAPPVERAAYDALLKQLTAHQHAILIDLGRTFPTHAYFRSPLGPGQLALFNLLKAYSLLDPEVGYCQGLSFVAGVLLLHMDEASAFHLLRHLMFVGGLREHYLPDMGALQALLYQLSRLVRDRLPAVHAHFDVHDVAPTLYAAPWLLTLFASQFPLGFVARVFDAVCASRDGAGDVLCRVSVALLAHHERALLACESFEEVMACMKRTLPTMTAGDVEGIWRVANALDCSAALAEYAVEYAVLHEEMQAMQVAHAATLAQLRQVEGEREKMRAQLEAADEHVGSLVAFVRHLVAQHASVPAEILRILDAHKVATSPTHSDTDSGVVSPSDGEHAWCEPPLSHADVSVTCNTRELRRIKSVLKDLVAK